MGNLQHVCKPNFSIRLPEWSPIYVEVTELESVITHFTKRLPNLKNEEVTELESVMKHFT